MAVSNLQHKNMLQIFPYGFAYLNEFHTEPFIKKKIALQVKIF